MHRSDLFHERPLFRAESGPGVQLPRAGDGHPRTTRLCQFPSSFTFWALSSSSGASATWAGISTKSRSTRPAATRTRASIITRPTTTAASTRSTCTERISKAVPLRRTTSWRGRRLRFRTEVVVMTQTTMSQISLWMGKYWKASIRKIWMNV